jgi:hypothetical protein
MAIPRPDINTFKFTSTEDKDQIFTAYFGDGAPLVIDGYGGWTVTGIPKEIGITEWEGRNPMAIEIPFVIDNYSFDQDDDEPGRGEQTEAMVDTLERMCGLGGHDQPPILRVQGHGVIPHDVASAGEGTHFWVIESVTWDRDIEIRSGESQRRLRCGGMIVIRQFKTASDILRRLGGKSRAAKPEIYVVKSGDTLTSIAAAKYHNPNKWKVIADANNLRDPRSLKVGAHLRIPR